MCQQTGLGSIEIQCKTKEDYYVLLPCTTQYHVTIASFCWLDGKAKLQYMYLHSTTSMYFGINTTASSHATFSRPFILCGACIRADLYATRVSTNTTRKKIWTNKKSLLTATALLSSITLSLVKHCRCCCSERALCLLPVVLTSICTLS